MSDDNVLGDADGDLAGRDSAILDADGQGKLLEVYATGETTVVGFGGRTIPANHNVAAYRNELLALIAEHDTRELAFDLTGMRIVPSGIVGLLATMHKQNVAVVLYNASPDIREVFTITRLDDVVTFRDLDV